MKNATQFHIRPTRPEEAGLFYAQHPEENKRLGAVGSVRMDFGRSGNEFWHTWWPRGPEELNSPAFKAELQEVVDTLRRAGELLQDLDNYQRITEDSARCIRTCQYAQRGLEGEILNAQKEEGRPSPAP